MALTGDLYTCVVGSRAFGLETEHSDIDLFRVGFGPPPTVERGHCYNLSPEAALRQILAEVPSASLRLLAAMFPASSSGGPVAEYLQQERDELVRQTRCRYYAASLQRAELFWGRNAEVNYREKRALKFPMYAVFLYRVIADYANGVPMAECLRPEGEWRDWLLAVRRGEIPFPELLSRKRELHKRALGVEPFWTRPGDENYILRVRRELAARLCENEG